MTTKNNGGPVYPCDVPPTPAELQLRDYFAGQALPEFIALSAEHEMGPAEVASDCFMIADAMLAERKKRGEA